VAKKSMDNVKNDRYYVSLIVDDIDLIISDAKHANFSDVTQNPEAMDAINFRIGQIREAVKGLSPSFVSNHPEIDFNGIILMRNEVTHDYENVDFFTYRNMVSNDFPKIRKILMKYLK
jgi:uncharacterized protein with HEPN domain